MKAALEALLLPPGLFLLLAVASVACIAAKKRVASIVLIAVAAVSGYLLSTEALSNSLLLPLENRYPPLISDSGATAQIPEQQRTAAPNGSSTGIIQAHGSFGLAEAVVVLGGGTVIGEPGNPAFAMAADVFKRVEYGKAIADRLGLPIILSGGAVYVPPGTPPEADTARNFLIATGFAPNRIYIEDESTTTWENAVNVVAEYHPDKIILVTSAFHMARAVFSFRAQRATVIPAPTDYLADRPPYTPTEWLPDAAQLWKSMVAIHEYIGLFAYHLRE